MQPIAIYIHVPFCATRCGYCDFNTYTATELGDSVARATFHRVLIDEIVLAARSVGARPVTSVFIGGGTPTLLGARALNEILSAVRDEFDLVDDAEVTTEANPDSVDEAMLAELRSGGFTRISLGMQSAAPHVLAVLDRTHTPGRSVAMARAARSEGFAHVNLDLIYATPGEEVDDLRHSLDLVLEADVDHVSAYSLIVEEGTPLARRVRQGELPMPDDDVAASRYELIDEVLVRAGFDWYEVSNWARPGGECQHNMAYWTSADWWGIGPGAHSHLAGKRWWNHKHPRTYAESLASGLRPEAGHELLSAEDQRTERVMLAMRMRTGLPRTEVADDVSERLCLEGLIDPSGLANGSLILTRTGRLLADSVVRDILT